MDLIYMDSSRRDVGVMQHYDMDMAFGSGENNFECKVPAGHHHCHFGYGLYVEGTEYGGMIDSISSDTTRKEVTYAGRTWHGIIASKIILPLQSGEKSTGSVTVHTTDENNASLTGKYLVLSGDANACIRYILQRIGLGSLFSGSAATAGATVEAFKFERYTDAYTGIRQMLASVGHKLRMTCNDGRVVCASVPRYNYAEREEFDSFQFGVRVKKDFRPVNHLICLGGGELEERTVVHLFADHYGNISTTQTLFGENERADVYDYSAVESEEELVDGGTKRLKELWSQDSISIDFDEMAAYDVGDIVGAVENVTGVTVSAEVAKKIVTIKNGKITIDLETGNCTGLAEEYRAAYRMRIDKRGHLICTYDGVIPPPLRINEAGRLVYEYNKKAPKLTINTAGHLILTEE